MKTFKQKIVISLFFMMVLILPMGISVVHALHQHESNLCLAKTESHYHSAKTNCDQLHYFVQTINNGETPSKGFEFEEILLQTQFLVEFYLAHSFPQADPDRGPPIINVF